MNPKGCVVNENTNGIITVNGHSYEDKAKQTENTNFALLVSKHFSEPFKDSNGYGESIARLSNMLGGGVIVQRFGDLIRGRRSNPSRIKEGLVVPTLDATPGDLSLVLPKRILDGIIEMIYALDKIAPAQPTMTHFSTVLRLSSIIWKLMLTSISSRPTRDFISSVTAAVLHIHFLMPAPAVYSLQGNLSKLKIDGEPPFPIREDRLHNKQHIMPECKIASVYAVYAVGAFIGRPH